MSPFRAARSSAEIADFFCAAVAPLTSAFFSEVLSAERCARLRTVAVRVLRMFFAAERILGTLVTP